MGNNDLKKYTDHLPHCNKKQDWSEAIEALSFSPDGIDKYEAEKELDTLMKKCTCGLDKIFKQ